MDVIVLRLIIYWFQKLSNMTSINKLQPGYITTYMPSPKCNPASMGFRGSFSSADFAQRGCNATGLKAGMKRLFDCGLKGDFM